MVLPDKPRWGQRGSVLVLALFFMMTLFLLAVSFLRLMPTEMFGATRQATDLAAYYAADAGVQEAIEHIEWAISAGQPPTTGAPSGTLPTGWSYSTSIVAASGTTGMRAYKITSEAGRPGAKQRKVTAYVVEDSWLRFQLYLDSNGTLTENVQFEGPVKVDGILTEEIKNIDELAGPLFLDTVETTEQDKKSTDGVTWKKDKPETLEDYAKIFEDGRSALSGGAESVDTPISANDVNGDKEKDILDLLAVTAFGTESVPSDKGASRGLYVSNTTTGGLFPKSTAGVYIAGSVQQMELGTRNGNPALRIAMPGEKKDEDSSDDADTDDFAFDDSDMAASDLDGGVNYYVVTYVKSTLQVGAVNLDAANSSEGGYTVVTKPDGTSQIYEGLTNGVVYVSKNIKQIGGEESGLLTIAAGKSIKVTDQIDYRNKPKEDSPHGIVPNTAKAGLTVKGLEPGQEPDPRTTNLGLVSRKLKLKFKSVGDEHTPDNFYLYANLIATEKMKGNLKKEDSLDLFGSLLLWNDKTKKKTKIFNKKSDIDLNYLGEGNVLPGIPGMGNFHISSYVENRMN